MLAAPYYVKITPSANNTNCTVTYSTTAEGTYSDTLANYTLNVVNTTGVELPSTGGMGNTLFTITGCAILAASAAYVVINRKKITDK